MLHLKAIVGSRLLFSVVELITDVLNLTGNGDNETEIEDIEKIVFSGGEHPESLWSLHFSSLVNLELKNLPENIAVVPGADNSLEFGSVLGLVSCFSFILVCVLKSLKSYSTHKIVHREHVVRNAVRFQFSVRFLSFFSGKTGVQIILE